MAKRKTDQIWIGRERRNGQPVVPGVTESPELGRVVPEAHSGSPPTLHALAQLPERDPRIPSWVANLGSRLVPLIEEGRWAFVKGDRVALASVAQRYAGIKGNGGEPDSIDEWLAVAQKFRGNIRTRAAVVEIIQPSCPHLDEDTILRYMRGGPSAFCTESGYPLEGRLRESGLDALADAILLYRELRGAYEHAVAVGETPPSRRVRRILSRPLTLQNVTELTIKLFGLLWLADRDDGNRPWF